MIVGKYSSKEIGFFYVDIWNMMLGDKDGDGHEDDDSDGTGDALGRTMRAYFTYGDPILLRSILYCWFKTSEGYMYYRHPLNTFPMSRDHYKNSMVAFAMSGNIEKIQELIDNVPIQMSEMARLTLGLRMWSKALVGNKRAARRFYRIEIATMPIYYILQAIGFPFFNQEVDQKDWGIEYLQHTPWKRPIHKIMPQAFAIQQMGWMLKVMPDSFGKRLLTRLYRPLIGKTNYVLKLLFGMKVSREQVEAYQPMVGGRWSGYLSNRNDRPLEILNPIPKVNNLDKDLLIKLFIP